MPSLSLEGMGILNIYLRLHLMYGENSQFELTNTYDDANKNKVTGACVILGGLIDGGNDYA